MIIKNKTKKTIITNNALLLTKEKDRVKGLIGEKEPKSIMFHTRFGIHTFLMKFPIDVIILNEKREVVAINEKLKPNRIFLWNPKYKTVIELPAGTINNSKTNVCDKLTYIILESR